MMTEPRFVHLRMHSEYSVWDSTVRIDDAIARVREDGGVALGLTDMKNIFGGLRFYTHAMAAGLKPILGCDIRLRNPSNPEAPDEMGLLCMNHQGYHSLCVLLTRAFLDADSQFREQIDEAWFAEPGATEGLICITGGSTGKLSRLIQNGLESVARETLDQWKTYFPDRLYLELQRRGHPADEFNIRYLLNEAVRTGLPVVATHPIQFIDKKDFEVHEVRCCIAGGYRLTDPRREKRVTPEQYLKSEEEMCELFKDIPSALENTVEIAKRCNVDGILSKPQLPLFPTPGGMSLDDYMDQLSREGLEKRLEFLYADPKEREAKRPQYVERLDYELGIIKKMQFPGYFLIVQDFINWSKNNGVPVGPGRGSGAGSLVAYCLGITDLDPLKYDLLFERFLNPERVSMPDFDIDFCQYNRDRTIEYVKRTYGANAVSQIATFGTLGAKAVVRDVCRVMSVPFSVADRLSKLIPAPPGKPYSLQQAYDEVPEFKEMIAQSEQIQDVFRIAKALEGLVRNLGMHAGGVLIAPGDLTDFCPLYNSDGQPENTVSMFDKKDVENAGLVKFDFLGLTTLSILQRAKEYVDLQNPGTNFELERIPIDDVPTYKTFQTKNTVAVFQFESDGMQKILSDAQPDCLEDLIALNALYRPGPMDHIPSFIDRKFGREKVTYLDDRMASVLEETYGIMVYQEQVMRVAQVIGGYSLGGADLLRRAMGKKQVEEMKRQRLVFQEGAAERGVSAEIASQIFDQMEKFAGYGFNKSHAAAYSYVAYQTAYMKTHHTSAFMAANMCVAMDQVTKIKSLVEDTERNGVKVLPPDINQSDWFFTAPDREHIRYGLGGIKGMGRQQVEALMQERKDHGPFLDIFDLVARVPTLTARHLEGLISSGAFDSIDQDRGKLFGNIQQAIRAGQTSNENQKQDSLFGGFGEVTRIVSWVEAPSWSKRHQLVQEKSFLGMWMSGHMFDVYREELKDYGAVPLSKVQQMKAPNKDEKGYRSRFNTTKIAGIVTDVRIIQGKRGRIGVATIDDGTASMEVTLFDAEFTAFRHLLEEDTAVCAEVTIGANRMGEGVSLRVKKMMGIDEYRAVRVQYLKITLDGSMPTDAVKPLNLLIRKYFAVKGITVGFEVKDENRKGVLYMKTQVQHVDDLVMELQKMPFVLGSELVY